MTHKHGGSLEAGRPGACSRGRDYIHDLEVAQRESYSGQTNYRLKSQLLVCCILGSKKTMQNNRQSSGNSEMERQ